MSRWLAAFVLLLVTASALAPTAALAKGEPKPLPPQQPAYFAPSGADNVLLARIYARTPGGTEPLGRTGFVLEGGAVTHGIEVGTGVAGLGPLTVMLTGRRKDKGAHVEWEIRGASAAGGDARGSMHVKLGSMGHADLLVAGDTTLFASFEAGRSSSFPFTRLSDHFSSSMAPSTGMPAMAPPASAGAPAMTVPPMPASPSRAPSGTSLALTCAGGARFSLGTGNTRGRCEVDLDDGGMTMGGHCDDGAGNAARASCKMNGGQGGCLSVSGTALCIAAP